MKNLFLSISMLVLVLASTACSTNTYMRIPQSHFDYPNSNIKPLSNSRISSVYNLGVSLKPPTLTSAVYREAYNQALSKVAGADMLIDIDFNFKITQIPIPILTLYSGKIILEGTPVDMEIGKQKLN